MLILTRIPEESIEIGDDIVISVLEVRGKQVKIGITAPKHINIRRTELPPRDGKPTNKGSAS